MAIIKKSKNNRDFPDGPVLGLCAPNSGGTGLVPTQGTKIPHAAQHHQKNKNNKSTNNKWWRTLEKKETLYLLVGMQTGAATMENSIPKKLQVAIWSSNPTSEYTTRKDQSSNSKR